MKAFIFPGQGSQKRGMGENLFDEFSEYTQKASAILGYSIKDLCLTDPENNLTNTQFTQPALYVVNVLTYLHKIKANNEKPDFVAGHSLGEYSALFAAGVFDFETGLKLVKYRGELMSQAENGGMAAIIGLTEEEILSVFKENNIEDIDLANFNSPSQIVISGPKASVVNAKEVFEKSGAKHYIVLNVGGAFHSRYMKDAYEKFKTYIDEFKFSEIQIPIISNVYARPYSPDTIKKTLADQIVSTVKWTETIRYMQGFGEINFEEVGPGYALTGLVNKIIKESTPLTISLEEQEQIKAHKRIIAKVEDKRNDKFNISSDQLGSEEFKKEYDVKFAYIVGSMFNGIASPEMISKLVESNILGILGTSGLEFDEVNTLIQKLPTNRKFGVNLCKAWLNDESEERLIDLYLKNNISIIETSEYYQLSSAIVRYRLSGIVETPNGTICANRIIAKISNPEIAEMFLNPPPTAIVDQLAKDNLISEFQRVNAHFFPIASDICILSDSAGFTSSVSKNSLLPVIQKIKEHKLKENAYKMIPRIGVGGGIGSPDMAATAFILGADFILTGSINQCTIESGLTDNVKNKLNSVTVYDTDVIDSGNFSDISSKLQIIKNGSFFYSRWNKLSNIYTNNESINELSSETLNYIEENCLRRSIPEVFDEIKSKLSEEQVLTIEADSKLKMKLIFNSYQDICKQAMIEGNEQYSSDYYMPCSSALGAVNNWLKGSSYEKWNNRQVSVIAEKLMDETAETLVKHFNRFLN